MHKKDILRGRLGICGHNSGRRNSSAQITTIDALVTDTTSLGKTTGSDPVEDPEKAAAQQSGSNDCVIDNRDLSIMNENFVLPK